MNERDPQDDALNSLLSDFNDVASEALKTESSRSTSQKRGRKGKPTYRSALSESQTDRRQAAKATGKKATLAGQYVRRSFTFRPDQLESVEQVAVMLGLSQNDLIRWFTDMGIETVEQGTRPPVAEEVRHRYDPGG
jgi:hypothetical protein